MKVKLENVRVIKAALTDQIYAGIVKENGLSWEEKVDVTNDVIKAVLERWGGYSQNLKSSEGKWYRISCKELTEEEIAECEK